MGKDKKRFLFQTTVIHRTAESSPATSAVFGEPIDSHPTRLGRSSFEAYAAFVVTVGYAAMSAFGISVNFYAGCLFLLFAGAAATDFLWRSEYTKGLPTKGCIGITIIMVIMLLFLINQGYVVSHHHTPPQIANQTKNGNSVVMPTSMVQNLFSAIHEIQVDIKSIHSPSNNTASTIRRPWIGLKWSLDQGALTAPNPTLRILEEETNTGDGLAKRISPVGGIFLGDKGIETENQVFNQLRMIKSKETFDQPPNGHSGFAIEGMDFIKPEDGKPWNIVEANNAIFSGTKILYVAVRVTYRDEAGNIHHTEQCLAGSNLADNMHYCTSHNGMD